MSFFEVFIYVFVGVFGKVNIGIGVFQIVLIFNGLIYIGIGFVFFIVFQFGLVLILFIFLDELVSKWGIGSGISLFIVVGVFQMVIYRFLVFVQSNQYIDLFMGEFVLIGVIFVFIQYIFKGDISGVIYCGGIFLDIVKLIGMIVVFFVVVYLESMCVEIFFSYGCVIVCGRYLIRFMYVSNILIIFIMVFYVNIQFWVRFFVNYGYLIFGQFDSVGNLVGGFVIYFYLFRDIFYVINDLVRVLVYVLMIIFWLLIFGFLWVEFMGFDVRSIVRQFQNVGFQIFGFRRDLRIFERVFQRYILYVIFWGFFIIVFVVVLVDFFGVFGIGIGIFLMVGIFYRFYEEIVREQVIEMFLVFRKFFVK